MFKCDKKIENMKPDKVAIVKQSERCGIIDIARQDYNKVCNNEEMKFERCDRLLWDVK